MLGALAPATFLAVDPAGWYPFGPVKWLAVSVLGFGGVAAVLAVRPVSLPRPLGLAVVVWLGWLVVAAAVGLDPLYAWIGTPERHLGVLTWVLCALLLVAGSSLGAADAETGVATPPSASNRRRIDANGSKPTGPGTGAVLGGLVVAGLGVGAVATAEAIGWEPDVLDVGSRLTATFGSAAYLGAATALLLPICLGVALTGALPRLLRTGAGAAVPLLLVAGVGSGARAAWFGLVVAALTTAWVQRSMLAAQPRRVAGAVAAGAVAIAAVLLVSPAGARLSSLTDPDAPGGRGRVDEWRVAARVAVAHPVSGVGPEGYRIAFAQGVDARYERAHGREQQPDRAHAAPLDVALAAGAPGLVAWVAVVVLVGRRVLRGLRHGSGWLVGLAAGLVAHAAGQLLLFPLVEVEPVAWLLAGLVVAATGSAPPPRRWVAPRVTTLALGAVGVVALVAGVTEVRADRRAGDASDALARGDHAAAAAAALDAVEQRPDIVRLHVLAAAALVADERGTLAGIRELDRALEVSPGDPIVLLARARLLVDRAAATQVPAHVERATDELRRLLADDPHNGALWREAGRLALVRGDDEAARVAAERADALTPTDRSAR
jgi:hypothetical protein